LSTLGQRLARLRWAATDNRRRFSLRLRRAGRTLAPFGRLKFRRFMFAPPDLRTTDPTLASDIYAGQFVFAGRIVSTEGRSPFEIEPPSDGWAEALYGFGWLRHLQAARTALARENARSLVMDFARAARARPPAALRPATTARRLMAFLAHSPLVLEGAEHEFYMAYLAAVARDAARLRDARRLSDDPLVRLYGALALCAVGLCVEGAERLERRFGKELAHELDEQILADGGHVSRNPRVLIDLLLDALPLRATYGARGLEPPASLVSAIDRIVPHLKMLRHPDGSIALFNGMGASQVDALATIFATHDSGGRAATEAPYAGYQRMEASASVLIVETGPSPPFESSSEAVAGCLSFEFSDGRQRLFVNCGMPRQGASALPVELRSTAAHSATSLGDVSSCRFISRGAQTRILSGPKRVTVTRMVTADGERLDMSHDGYAATFGVTLRRGLTLGADGGSIAGSEDIEPAARAQEAAMITRFHLFPGLGAEILPEGGVLIAPPRGRNWLFTAEGASVSIEESVFFAAVDGARRTVQIVLTAEAGRSVTWRAERQGRPDEVF
jgi:uncharacterized heparinase superfamily protein